MRPYPLCMGVSGGLGSGARVQALTGAPASTLVATAAGLAVTSAILFTPYLTFGVRSPQAHLVLNTLDAAIGLLAAFLVYGRLVRRRLLQDLLVILGLALLVLAGLGVSNVVDAFPGARPGTLDVWLPLSFRVAGAVLIAAAALVGPRRQVRRARDFWPALTALLVVSVSPVVLWAGSSSLPLALDLSLTPASAQRPILTGHPLLLGAQAFAALCFAIAAVLFSRQADDGDNELLLWLGPACALGAFARLNYVLFPSLYTDWLYTGDLLRTGFYVLLLVGAAIEIQRYWSDRADLAVLEDRRRLARELHDGVIQELSYIKSQGGALGADPEVRHQVLAACERGLEEARAAVVALGASGDEPLGLVLARATTQLAEQYDVKVVQQLDHTISVDPEERHTLVRIAREAVTNAVKHGGAERIEVLLEFHGEERLLAVRDDGRGFDPTVLAGRNGSGATGYGLISMHERARSLAGQLVIESTAGSGTEVRLTW